MEFLACKVSSSWVTLDSYVNSDDTRTIAYVWRSLLLLFWVVTTRMLDLRTQKGSKGSVVFLDLQYSKGEIN